MINENCQRIVIVFCSLVLEYLKVLKNAVTGVGVSESVEECCAVICAGVSGSVEECCAVIGVGVSGSVEECCHWC